MITDKDTQKMIQAFLPIFATKEDLRQHDEKTDDKLTNFRSDIINNVDHVFGELKTMREEQSVHRQEHDDVNERLDKIESVPLVAHELKKKR